MSLPISNNPAFSNHLSGEQSPYLLQHVHNPVDWYPWGQVAFDKSRKEDKPILLSVGYSTCHWCHVMAHESFEDDKIAKIINEHFVAIKVDREERPDIDHIYMTATTALTGQGGWPMTVFLTTEAEPFYAGTYFPPYAKWGAPGLVDVLDSIAKAWKDDRENVIASGRSITEAMKKLGKSENSSHPMNEELLHQAYRQIRGQYDSQYGGLGHAPKFPMGHNLSFLLRYHRRYKDDEALGMVKKTLTAIHNGGIWDHLAGGFHRYSTDQYWHVPHFEKMLYDQALLSKAYLEAYQVTGLLEFAQVACETLDYCLNEMRDEKGGFYSAQDADSMDPQGNFKEGAFYVFSQTEIEEALGHEEAEIFNFCYGVLPQGNAPSDPQGEFVGKNILYLAHSIEEASAKFHRQSDEIQGILREGRSKLLEKRHLRPLPHKDIKVLCDWNGLMIASLAFAGQVLAEARYTKAAIDAADFILAQMMPQGRLWHRWHKGQAGIAATLEDYAFFTYALLEVYEACFDEKYLKAAGHLTDEMIRLFADEAGGFFMTASDAEDLILRPKEIYDGAYASGNSVAALVLWKLEALKQRDEYRLRLESLYHFFVSTVARAPYAHCFLLSSLDAYLEGALEIKFQGAMDNQAVSQMRQVLYKHFLPSKVVEHSPSSGPGKVQICRRGVCQLPTDNAGVFETQLIERS